MKTRALFSVLMVSMSVGAASAQSYPVKPIRWIVPYPAGGGSDTVARTIALKLQDALGQPVVVDNRGGAAGVVGTEMGAAAPADGYTLVFAVGSFVVTPFLNSNVKYDPVRDFAPVSLLAINPYLFAANAALPVNSVKELIAYAKTNPGKLNYGTAGAGGGNHLAMELFNTMAGTAIVHVPYKGSAPGITDLISGQLQLMMNTMGPLLPHVKTGRLKALAVTGAVRSPAVPNTPTVAESGLPGFEYVNWYAALMPARTPKDIIAKINSNLVAILALPDIAPGFAAQGFEPRSSSPEDLGKFMKADSDRVKKVIASAGIRAE
ncbi:MAG: tripartite tricarboxylate transporter substrate binding protein [Betaproteobacteria bacterium]|nr:tripartite tricarboxylate transporter substrate binding protein [Betaproteobacteria bacterium]